MGGEGSAKSTLNTTWMTFIGILPESTSNVSFQIAGGYDDDNLTYSIAPNNWFIRTLTVRARDANETKSFPHTDITIKLEDPNGSAVIKFWHHFIEWDPDVNQYPNSIGLEGVLSLVLIVGSLLLLIVLSITAVLYRNYKN